MKSKKIVTVLVVIVVMCCSTLFAAEAKEDAKKQDKAASDQLEFNMSPAIGFSAAVYPEKKINGTLSIAQFDLGLNATMIGIPWPTASGFGVRGKRTTLMLDAEIGMGGKLTLKTEAGSASAKPKKAVSFLINALVGYTFEPFKDGYLVPAIGLGSGVYRIEAGYEGIYEAGISIPLYLSVKYFFTDLVGIEATAINSFLFLTTTRDSNFINTFVLKVGPVFRFNVKM